MLVKMLTSRFYRITSGLQNKRNLSAWSVVLHTDSGYCCRARGWLRSQIFSQGETRPWLLYRLDSRQCEVLDTLYKVKGEFLSMQAIHAATPEAAPAPLAYGTYASDLKLHFILLPYIAMTDEPPTFDLLVVLKRLHMSTTSPTGKFGLEHPTYHHHVAAWTDTWEEYFTRHMRQCMAVETSTHGSTLEIEELHQKTLELVIPRLLRPMETGGRKLKPSLVHGDLWEGNTSMELKPYRATIFDAGSLYAHNECKTSGVPVAWRILLTT